MKKLIAALIVALPFAAGSAVASDKAPTGQQSKMSTCNKDAGDKKGDERKAFMSECLKKDTDGRKAQQEKMKQCSAENKGKKGEEYKKAQKECLSK
jgi:psiF repeat